MLGRGGHQLAVTNTARRTPSTMESQGFPAGPGPTFSLPTERLTVPPAVANLLTGVETREERTLCARSWWWAAPAPPAFR